MRIIKTILPLLLLAGSVSLKLNAQIGGSISTGQIAFGSGTNTISGTSNLAWDNTKQVLSYGGTTPSTWTSMSGIIEGGGSSIFLGLAGDIWTTSNGYHNSGWYYKTSGKASNIGVYDGEVWIRTAPSGTINTSLTYTMPLKASYSSGGVIGLGGNITTTSGSLTGATMTVGPSLVSFPTDNTVDIGANGATRPRSGYFGTSIYNPLLIGGTSTTSPLTLRSTSASGTTGSDIIFQVGNNGATEALRILNNGKIGIGLTSPSPDLKLEINGNMAVQAGQKMVLSGGIDHFSYVTYEDGNLCGLYPGSTVFGGFNGSFVFMDGEDCGEVLTIQGGITNALKMRIGANNSTMGNHLLAVSGSAIFTKAFVKNTTNWPDYVFEEKYQLMPIPELEKYLKQNKHLPGVPSAKEIEKDGINLGENQSILLKKVEELTLYIIGQNKKIELLEKQNVEIMKMQTQLDELKKLVIAK